MQVCRCGEWVWLETYRNTTTSSTTSMTRSRTAMVAIGAMITAGLRGVAITAGMMVIMIIIAGTVTLYKALS